MRKMLKRMKSMLSLLMVVIILASVFQGTSLTAVAESVQELTVSDLRIELMNNPLMVENLTAPVLSWVINSVRRGTLQSAYQVNVYDESGSVYWDSGKVPSSKSSGVKYSGAPLLPWSSYTWQVMVWDQNDDASLWSEAASFMTALKDSWKAETSPIWASGTNNWAFFRKEFTVENKPIEKVMLYATGYDPAFGRQQIYRMTLNGEFVGVGPTRHYSESGNRTRYEYNQDIFYNAYDVTGGIAQGTTNAIGVICCSGTSRAFMAELRILYKDGDIAVMGTDATWKAFSNNTVYGTNRYHNSSHAGWVGHTGYNEYIRGDLYPFGFDKAGFNDTTWGDAVANTNINKSRLVGYGAENMTEETVQPVKITKHTNGNWIVDYGEAVWGGFILNIDPQDASWDGSAKYVDIREGEVLYGPGTPGATVANTGTVKYQAAMGCNFNDRFYLLNQQQTMRMWGTHTFRYAEFIGLPDFVNDNNFTDYVTAYRLIYPMDASVSRFESSNEMLDEIFEFCKRSIEILNIDLYVDSPNRERLPYEADAYIQQLGNYATFDDFALARVSAEHMLFNPTWPLEWKMYAIKMMYTDYLNTGDNTLLVKYYNEIKGKLPAAMTNGFNAATGIVNKAIPSGNGDNADIIDWPSRYRTEYSRTAQNVVTNSFFYNTQMTLGKIAEAVGNQSEAADFYATAEISKAGIQANFFDTDRNMFKDSLTGPESGKTNYSSVGNTFVAAWGAASDEQAKGAAAYLASRGELKGGVYSSAFAVPVLFRYGQGAAAVQYITGLDNEGNPLLVDGVESIQNWRNMIELGSGSTMEAWSESHDGTVSHSHPWGTSPAYALVDDHFGIVPLSPAFETFQIKPVEAGLANASVSRPTIRGVIESSYKKEEDKYTLDVTIPANTTATVYFPTNFPEQLAESGRYIDNVGDVTVEGYENGYVVMTVGSGSYHFAVGYVIAEIRADEAAVEVNNPASYTVSLVSAKGAGIVTLSFTADSRYLNLTDATVTVLNGFSIVDPLTWEYVGSQMWKGTVKLYYPGFVQNNDPLDVLNITGVACDLIGDTTVTLTDFSVTGDVYGLSGAMPGMIRTAEAATSVVPKAPVYSKYDLNHDGRIDELDLAIVVYYYLANDLESDWDVVKFDIASAKDCDVALNGRVDLADMIEVIANYCDYYDL